MDVCPQRPHKRKYSRSPSCGWVCTTDLQKSKVPIPQLPAAGCTIQRTCVTLRLLSHKGVKSEAMLVPIVTVPSSLARHNDVSLPPQQNDPDSKQPPRSRKATPFRGVRHGFTTCCRGRTSVIVDCRSLLFSGALGWRRCTHPRK